MAEYNEKRIPSSDDQDPGSLGSTRDDAAVTRENRTFMQKVWDETKQPGSAIQIIIAAAIAIGIGLGVSSAVEEVPDAAVDLVGIPGDLWLRALKAVGASTYFFVAKKGLLSSPLTKQCLVLPSHHLRHDSGHATTERHDGQGQETGLVDDRLVCRNNSARHRSVLHHGISGVEAPHGRDSDRRAGGDLGTRDDRETYEAQQEDTKIHEVVVQMFESFIPQNIFDSLASNGLLAVVITSIVLGLLIKRGSIIVKLAHEISDITTRVITFLIYIAPIGVFFLILSNLFRLDPASIGQNLGVLIGGTIVDISIHLFIVLPALFFIATRTNPYSYWFKCARAWVTAWGTASSAATLSVTLQCAKDRGVPYLIRSFCCRTWNVG